MVKLLAGFAQNVSGKSNQLTVSFPVAAVVARALRVVFSGDVRGSKSRGERMNSHDMSAVHIYMLMKTPQSKSS